MNNDTGKHEWKRNGNTLLCRVSKVKHNEKSQLGTVESPAHHGRVSIKAKHIACRLHARRGGERSGRKKWRDWPTGGRHEPLQSRLSGPTSSMHLIACVAQRRDNQKAQKWEQRHKDGGDCEDNSERPRTRASHFRSMWNSKMSVERCHRRVLPPKLNGFGGHWARVSRRDYVSSVLTELRDCRGPEQRHRRPRRRPGSYLSATGRLYLACPSDPCKGWVFLASWLSLPPKVLKLLEEAGKKKKEMHYPGSQAQFKAPTIVRRMAGPFADDVGVDCRNFWSPLLGLFPRSRGQQQSRTVTLINCHGLQHGKISQGHCQQAPLLDWIATFACTDAHRRPEPRTWEWMAPDLVLDYLIGKNRRQKWTPEVNAELSDRFRPKHRFVMGQELPAGESRHEVFRATGLGVPGKASK